MPSKFNVGDRVRYWAVSARYVGVGTVLDSVLYGDEGWWSLVDFDSGHHLGVRRPEHLLERVNPLEDLASALR